MRRCLPTQTASCTTSNGSIFTSSSTSSWNTRLVRRRCQRGGANLAPLRASAAAGHDRVIAPIEPAATSSLLPDAEAVTSIASRPAAGPAARRAARQQQQGGRTPAQRERRPNTRHDGNRGGLVNVRVAPHRWVVEAESTEPGALGWGGGAPWGSGFTWHDTLPLDAQVPAAAEL